MLSFFFGLGKESALLTKASFLYDKLTKKLEPGSSLLLIFHLQT